MTRPARKYSFITSLQYLDVREPLGSGWQVSGDLKFSTSNSIARRIVTPTLRHCIGEIDAQEVLSGKPFLFAEADYPHQDTSLESQERLLTNQLQAAVMFCNVLWLIRDNSVNFDRGFLQYPFERTSPQPRVSANSWTTLFSCADGQLTETKFSKSEIEWAADLYRSLYKTASFNDVSFRGTLGTARSVDRLSRAFYFLQAARAMNDLPAKVTYYIICFETLLSDSNTEVAHQIAERVAVLIGKEQSQKLEIYRNLKKGL